MRIITSNNFLAQNSNEWFARKKPDWIKKNNQEEYSSTSTCPSFVELFKNTFVFCNPVEIMILTDKNTNMYAVQTADHQKFMEISSHNFADQLDSTFAEKYFSLKFKFPDVSVLSDKVESLIFMPCEYHFSNFPNFPMQAMIGVLETIPNKSLEITFNFKVDKKIVYEREEWLIPKNTPLAYCYFPNGAPKQVEYISKEEIESTRWFPTEFNCPYLRELNETKKST